MSSLWKWSALVRRVDLDKKELAVWVVAVAVVIIVGWQIAIIPAPIVTYYRGSYYFTADGLDSFAITGTLESYRMMGSSGTMIFLDSDRHFTIGKKIFLNFGETYIFRFQDGQLKGICRQTPARIGEVCFR